MTYYQYTAIDQLGRQQRGCMDVPSEQSLVECLQQQELELLTYKLGQPLFRRQPRVNSAVLIVFCIQME